MTTRVKVKQKIKSVSMKFKKLQLIILLLMNQSMMSLAQETCANSQISLNSNCVDCNALFYGCISCSLKADSVSSLQCDTCDFGYYMLNVSTEDQAVGGKINMCVEKCEDFGYNWVANKETMRCEYCGPTCTLCSPKYGCLADYKWDRAFKYVDSSQYPAGQFPFSSTAPSPEFVTTKECADPRCDKCQTLDSQKQFAYQSFLQCNSCFTYVNNYFEAQQALLPCELCDSNDVANCLNCDPDEPGVCISCQSDYYIDRDVNECLSCSAELSQAQGCKRCDADSCLECLPGYFEVEDPITGKVTCSKCDLADFNSAYQLQPNRCTQCVGVSNPRACKYCDVGFLGSSSNPDSCELRCDVGQYPNVTYTLKNQNENLLETTECISCDSSCSGCIGPGSTQCTSCPESTMYLSIFDINSQSGACLPRIAVSVSQVVPTFDIYVSNLEPVASLLEQSRLLSQTAIGSFDIPFYHLDDALERAKELAAQYEPSVTIKVNINLFKGDHFTLASRGGSTLPYYTRSQYLSGDNLNYALTIQPLVCSKVSSELLMQSMCFDSISQSANTVTIFNKRREKLRFDVPVSLTLSNVIINGIDSILYTQPLGNSLPTCLSERRQCCQLDQQSGVVQNVSADDISSFSCADSFKALFKTMETDCFANWPRSLFKMRATENIDGIKSPNALIFTNGSKVVNTFYAMNSLVAFTSAGGTVRFSKATFSHLHICGSIVKDTFMELPQPDIRNYVSRTYMSDAQVTMIETIWKYQAQFAGKTPAQQYMDTVSTVKEQVICGSLSLCTQVLINQESLFTAIPFGQSLYSQAQLVSSTNGLRNQGYLITLESGAKQSSLEVYNTVVKNVNAPVDGCAPYNSLTAINQSKVQAVGSMNNFRQLFNPTSKFDKAQVQGPFILRQHRGPVVFAKNTFNQNISYGGLISAEQTEGAFWVSGNSFGSNSAMVNANVISIITGLESIQGSTTERQCGGITIKENQFTNNFGCSETVGAISARCLASSGWSYNDVMATHSFNAVGKMQIPSNLSFTTLSTVVTSDKSLIQDQVDAKTVTISNNNFSYNFAGTNTAVTSILGFPQLVYNTNVHFQNENWIANSFRTQSTLFRQQSSTDLPLALTSPQDVLTRAKAIVHVRAISTLVSTGCTYENNFVLDMFSPFASAGTIQSNGILIQDLEGVIDLSNSNFLRNSGLSGNNRVGLYPVPNGFTSRLIAFQDCTIKSLAFNDMTFESNKGDMEIGAATLVQPQLFVLNQGMFERTSQEVQIQRLVLSGNEFYNTGSIVTFHLQNLVMPELNLRANYGDNILLFYYANDRAKVTLNNPQVSTNSVVKGATLMMEEAKDFVIAGYTSAQALNYIHLQIIGGSFANNIVETLAHTSESGPRTSCIEFKGVFTNWAQISLKGTELKNNLGVVTNEIYADDSVASLALDNVEWRGSVRDTSSTKMAQVIYRPPSFHFDLSVKRSTFTCTGVTRNEDVILQNDISSVIGRASLFNLAQAENIQTMPLLKKEDAEQNTLVDGFLASDDFIMRFERNKYTGCNHAEKGAIFYLEAGARLIDLQSDYESCSAMSGGLAFVTGHGTYLKIELPSTQISEMFAYQGALVYVEKGATVEMTNSVIVKYSEAYEGTIAFVNDRARFILNSACQISYNRAHRRGLFSVTDGSQIQVDDCQITSNKAGYDSVVLHAENNRVEYHLIDGSSNVSSNVNTVLKSWITNSEISRNSIVNQGRIMSVIESNVTVSSVGFKFNDATTDSYGIYVSYSEMEISDCTFIGPTDTYLLYDLDNAVYNDVNGAFLQVQEQSLVLLTGSTFTGGRSIYGGCILLSGYSRLKIEDCDFYLCTGMYGGAIYADSHRSLHIYRSHFTDNFSFMGYGQNIYSQNAMENLWVEDTYLQSYHNSIYTSGYSFQLLNCTLEGDQKNQPASKALTYRSDGAALYIEHTARVVVKKSEFRNFLSRNGGAIYIEQERLTTTALTKAKSFNTIRPYLFQDVKFDNCTAEFDGGAIFVKNPLRMTLESATFFQNKALKEGGAIQFICEPSPRELRVDPNTPCDFVMDGVEFRENQASVGGAIRWNLMEMEVTKDQQGLLDFEKNKSGVATYGSILFSNNSATDYGPEIASVARELIRFSSQESYIKYFKGNATTWKELVDKKDRKSFFNYYRFSGVQSGGNVPTIYLGLIDKYGQLVTIDKGSKITFDLLKSENTEYETKIIGVTDFFSAYGTYNMSGMGLVTGPGSDLNVNLTVYGIDLKVPSNREYLSEQLGRNVSSDDTNGYLLNMDMKVRGCVLGEGLRESGACYECPAGFYLLQAPVVPELCQSCPQERAFCLGGKKVGPQKGFWRTSATSYDFWPCPAPEQCLGMDQNLPFDYPGNAVGLCDTEKGYYGVMCTACLPGYKRSGLTGCEKCESSEIIRVIIIFIGLVSGLCFLIRATLKSAVKGSDSSVFNKILMNHLQMLIITSDFDMDWPGQVKAIFNIAAPINELTEAIVNFDCFMDDRNIADVDPYGFDLPDTEVRVYSQKVFIMVFLPIGLGMLAYLVWYIICRIKKQMEKLQTKFIATLVLLLFLVHPAMTKRMVDVFNCTSYGGVSRLSSDLQVKCYADEKHSFVAYYVALPALFIWGLGIPATVFTLMRKNSDKLTTEQVKQQFGFLYNGYKRHNYYWEIVIMYRKIMCIFIAVFLRPMGVIVQALVLLIMLGGFLQANNTSRPFRQRQLNDIENMSVATQIITIYCGIFFISAKPQDENFVENRDFYLSETGKILLVMVIAFCNSFFILLWIMKFMEISREMIKRSSKRIYVYIFLCGRWDKLEKETARRAGVIKREKIIASIEDTVLFLKKMKNIYSNNIFYEDHDRFLRLMYHTELEVSQLDMTEKRNNFYIQGPMARQRKFDRERMKELQNEQSLEVDENLIQVMEDQRGGDMDSEKENNSFHETPYLKNLQTVRKAQKKRATESSPNGSVRRFMSQRTIMMPNRMESGDMSMSQMSPDIFKTSNRGLFDVKPVEFPDFDAKSEAASPTLQPQNDIESGGVAIQSPQDQPSSPFLLQPSQQYSMIFEVDQFGNRIDEDDDGDEYMDGADGDNKEKKGGEDESKKAKSKKKKNKEVYLDHIKERSRNDFSNNIKKDDKNLTVGKVQANFSKSKVSIDKLASILQSQFQNQKANQSGKSTDDLFEEAEEKFVPDFADVESLDSYDARIHMMRQLTGRIEDAGPSRLAVPVGGQKSAAEDQPGSGRSLGSQPMGSVKETGGEQTMGDIKSQSQLDGQELVSQTTKGKDIDDATDQQSKKPEEEPETEQKHDLGPAAHLLKLQEAKTDDVDAAYQPLRPRSIPRRQLHGHIVIDSYLDHSDSFRTIQTADEDAPDKSLGESSQQDLKDAKDAIDPQLGMLTPRQDEKRPSGSKMPVDRMEHEMSPESKFGIQMTPSKADLKGHYEAPIQKYKMNQPKILVVDHDKIDVPMIDNLMMGKQLPRYVPADDGFDTSEQKSSPAKSGLGDEELRVYDASQSIQSSSLHTDPSMKDYDFMIEPDEMFSFYMPMEDKKDDEDMGAGLGYLSSNMLKPNQPGLNYTKGGLLDLSQSLSQKSDSKKSEKSLSFPSQDELMDSGDENGGIGPSSDNSPLTVFGVDTPGIRKTLRKGFASK